MNFPRCYNFIIQDFVKTTEIEKLLLTSMSGSARRALNNVIVLPEPGGPQRTRGLCSASQVYKRDSCLTVSTVGITTSGAATL